MSSILNWDPVPRNELHILPDIIRRYVGRGDADTNGNNVDNKWKVGSSRGCVLCLIL